MKAIQFDGALRYVTDAPVPRVDGEALIQVICAGICNTDLEIAKGYAGFSGTLGHEFVGCVVESPDAEWVGRRVVGEINVGCGRCSLCHAGDSRHCPERMVLGIRGRDGAFAEYLSLPVRNLIAVPESITDEEAVFAEPLAAALHVLEQVDVTQESRVVILGDGKLAQLITQVMATTRCDLNVAGKHDTKLELAALAGAQPYQVDTALPAGQIAEELITRTGGRRFDVVVEATGSRLGLPLALALVEPCGTVVLKSTHQEETTVDMSAAVVNEVRLIGSRCGRLAGAVELLQRRAVNVIPLITHRIGIDEGFFGFEEVECGKALKVILAVR
ncbi:MAG TPA: alcohol dehydrogenase catalytic domain-containing protein [Blastocatellia bacterium]|nr:alcohol dehydrogenase catalytic domain-containing protein [Blastocatellia bacterium]